MTLAIEVVGVAILCIWIIVPIREFKEIFAAIARRQAARDPRSSESAADSTLGERGERG